MQLEVYQTDAEAYEAAAGLAAGWLAEALRATGRAAAGVAGGRAGRAWLVALAARRELPCDHVDWVPLTESSRSDHPDGTLRLLRDALGARRGVAAARMLAVPLGEPDPAVAWAAALEARFGAPPALDVACLALGDDGAVAGLVPGTVLASGAWAATVGDVVTMTAGVLQAARHVVLTATGTGCAAAVEAALREPADPVRRPAQLVLPSAAVTWVVDRDAAAALLRDARPAGPPP